MSLNKSPAKPREELFEKLSKTQLKAHQIDEMNQLKVEQELRDCTFKPQISKDKSRDCSKEPVERGTSDCSKLNSDEVWKRLYVENMESKNWEKIEKEKTMLELRECTFSPLINKRRSSSA